MRGRTPDRDFRRDRNRGSPTARRLGPLRRFSKSILDVVRVDATAQDPGPPWSFNAIPFPCAATASYGMSPFIAMPLPRRMRRSNGHDFQLSGVHRRENWTSMQRFPKLNRAATTVAVLAALAFANAARGTPDGAATSDLASELSRAADEAFAERCDLSTIECVSHTLLRRAELDSSHGCHLTEFGCFPYADGGTTIRAGTSPNSHPRASAPRSPNKASIPHGP